MKTLMVALIGSVVVVVGMYWYLETNTTELKSTSNDIIIENRWELPDDLLEISGLVYLGDGRFLCVQDENGTLYTYDTNSEEIKSEVSFAGKGDYEGLAVNKNTAYVVNSDGVLFVLKDFSSENPEVDKYSTFLNEDHNIEGVAYDKEKDRLLFTVKDEDPSGDNYKGIYAMDIKTMQIDRKPIFKISFGDPAFGNDEDKGDEKVFNPSGIDIHPVTGEMYIVDGKKQKLAIMDKSGKLKRIFSLDENVYQQPEGIAISDNGEVFISNEGNERPANILQVSGL